VQDPGRYIEELGATLPCAVDPGKTALLDPAHRIFVNWEAYFVSSDAALAEFRRAPWRYTGLVTDPVTGMRFQPQESSPEGARGDRTFFFSSDETLARFQQDPERYATPMLDMMEKAH